jgi:glycosyltransferase involved in cell wall biosynthesis
MAGEMPLSMVFITRKWAPAVGGMETWSIRMAEALARLCALEPIALPGKDDGMPPSAFSLLAFPFTVIRRLFALPVRPDAALLGDMAIWPLALVAMLRGARRIAIAAHGTDVAYHRRGGIRGHLYGAYLRLGARLLRNTLIIANSRATAEVLCETGWHNSAIVPLATDIVAPPPDGTHNGRLLFAGRLIERKGCGWFIREVLPLLPAHITLDIAGTGWNETERAMLDNPRVHFLGALQGEALIRAYRDALAVVIPNIPMANGEYEGFGLVAPEAAAAGGMVLAADCDGLRDAVIDGVTGRLLPPADAPAWAAAVVDAARQSIEERAEQSAASLQLEASRAENTHYYH